MPALSLIDLRYSHPDATPVFDGITLTLPPGASGLVGANGSGKSTLLALITGRLAPTGGRIDAPARLSFLAQSPDPLDPLAALFGATAALDLLRRAEAGAASPEDLAEADWELEARLDAALDRVGLGGVDLLTPVSRLSGGQRMRAALAAAFFDAPELVLLDEPTNNLDSDGRELVADLLAAHSGTALVASHDRDLLDRMDHILSLEAGNASIFGGGWTAFAEAREAARARAEGRAARAERDLRSAEREIAQRASRAAVRARTGKALRRSGSQAKMLTDAAKERSENSAAGSARLAERRRAAARAEAEAARAALTQAVPRRVEAQAARGAQVVLSMRDAGYRYGPGEPAIAGLNLEIGRGERVALEGPNGSGKSTALRLAAGFLEPTEGSIARPRRIAFLDQNAASLGQGGRLAERFRAVHPGLGRNAAHAALAWMGFRGAAGDAEIDRLSGGERVQAALALALAAPEPPELLILDEPTNHLDLPALEAVEQGLRAFDGAMLVVSHDVAFLRQIGIARRICLLPAG
ncbi:ATP-binding cassette domain-containing protein [Tropicimonas sp. IMCC6043]|uniref:ATP-binding cassette domain-containing protein n=1 Tax=Tropicimonas sp. IMCC6043 TaxID=2510645 RepID=UPI00101DD732|nr:ATP-binding cassette domain-containing protein [Tropicimonas sp. IMCC6043]RYH12190.1 ABC-F family ATP-binding cassette domain-containing protein [Tropicimonas sp. IMCC6043]